MFLPQQLTPGTYTQMFEVLLWCEEFKISYVSLTDTLHAIELKGIQERPREVRHTEC